MRLEPTVFPDPDALGDAVATLVLDRLRAHTGDRPFVLGCPGGRSAQTSYRQLATAAAAARVDLSRVVVAMMDEYVEIDTAIDGGRYRAVDDQLPHSCRRFGREDIVGRIRAWQQAAGVPQGFEIREDNLWLPDPDDPAAYDARLAAAGGVDVFLLASGASDGHVAFNPPGAAADSRTRVVALPDSTRRDNLATFPTFGGDLAAVPAYGVTVGIATVREQSREVVMIVHGAGKQRAAAELLTVTGYDPRWPATVAADCRAAHLFVDRAALPAPAGRLLTADRP